MKASTRAPWLGIELRHLAALSAVAREGSFRAAADNLGYVQSAVSQQLAHLEQLVEARLVERRRGSAHVALTEAGELVLHHGEEILERFAAAQTDVEALLSGRVGRLRVGVFESVAARLLPRILASFGRRAPGCEVELTEAQPAVLAEQVEVGELDVAFGIAPLPSGPFEARELLRDPYRLLVPVGWELPPQPGPEDVAGLPLIGGRDGRVEAELRAGGVEPRVVLRSTSDAARAGARGGRDRGGDRAAAGGESERRAYGRGRARRSHFPHASWSSTGIASAAAWRASRRSSRSPPSHASRSSPRDAVMYSPPDRARANQWLWYRSTQMLIDCSAGGRDHSSEETMNAVRG